MRIVIKDCSDVWRILYSTQNIRIAHKPEILPKNLIMSAVVFQELVAGAADRTELKRLQSVGKQYEKENKLLVPTGEDYFRAGKIMNSCVFIVRLCILKCQFYPKYLLHSAFYVFIISNDELRNHQ